MKTFPDSFSKNYADWSAVGMAMILGHAPAPASPDAKPNGKPAPHPVQGWEGEGGMLKTPKKAPAAPKPALRKAPAKKHAAKKAKRAKRR